MSYNAPASLRGRDLYAWALNSLTVPRGSLSAARAQVAAGTLTVAYVGDSILYHADMLQEQDGIRDTLTRELTEALPGVTVRAWNFAIGGRDYSQLLDSNYLARAVGGATDNTGFYRAGPWGENYAGSVQGKSWLDHVRDSNPGLVILGMGMNSVGGSGSGVTQFAQVTALIDAMRAWANPPSIVVVPTYTPSRDTTKTTQSGPYTLAVARAARAAANAKGAAVLDSARLWNVLLYGWDDKFRATQSAPEINWTTPAGAYPAGWTGDTGTFTLTGGNTLTPSGSVSTKFINSVRPFYDGEIRFDVVLRAANELMQVQFRWVNFTSNEFLIYNNALRFYRAGQQLHASAPYVFPLNTTISVRIIVSGSVARCECSIAGVIVASLSCFMDVHTDGTLNIGASGGVPLYSNLVIVYADPLQASPAYTEGDALGTAPFLATGSSTGNQINHVAATFVKQTYAAAAMPIIRALASP